MTAEHAEACDRWRYDPPYDFYDLRSDEDDRKEFMNPNTWGTELFAAIDDTEKLTRFFVIKTQGEALYIGFGIRPDLTGKRLGRDFIEQGIRFGAEKLDMRSPKVVLEVADFNERAKRLYRKIGFSTTRGFIQKTNEGEFPFVRLEKTSNQPVESTSASAAASHR